MTENENGEEEHGEEGIEELKPVKVEITNQPEIKEKNPTSEDTQEEYDTNVPSDEQIKEMTDAQ